MTVTVADLVVKYGADTTAADAGARRVQLGLKQSGDQARATGEQIDALAAKFAKSQGGTAEQWRNILQRTGVSAQQAADMLGTSLAHTGTEAKATTEQVRRLTTAGSGLKRGLDETGTAASKAGTQFHSFAGRIGFTNAEWIRAGATLIGLNVGLNLVAGAAANLREGLKASIETQIESQRIARVTTASYGQQATAFTAFAQQLSQQTGYTRNAILEAAISARTLSDNYGLSIQQTQKLIKISADLAQVRGIGVAQAFDRVQSAIRGETEASEYLGLTLGATFLAEKGLSEASSEAAKAQVRYAELVKQSARFTGLAEQASNSAEGSFRRLGLATTNLANEIGKRLLPALGEGADALARYMDWLAKGQEKVDQQREAVAKAGVTLGEFGPEIDLVNRRLITHAEAVERVNKVLEEMAEKERAARDAARAATLQPEDFGGPPAGSNPYLPGPRIYQTPTSPSLKDDAQRALDAVQAKQQLIDLEAQRGELEIRVARRAEGIDDQVAQKRAEIAAKDAEIRDVQATNLGLLRAEIEANRALLPLKEEQARREREIAAQVDKRLQLEQQGNLIRAQRGALPADAALQDAQTEIHRQQLIAQVDRSQRGAARQSIRAINRQLPTLELNALDADQKVTQAERAQRAEDLRVQEAQNGLRKEKLAIDDTVDAAQQKLDKIHQEQEAEDQRKRLVVAGLEAEKKALTDTLKPLEDRARQLDDAAKHVRDLADAYKDMLEPDRIRAMEALVDYQVKLNEAISNGSNAPGSGAGTANQRDIDVRTRNPVVNPANGGTSNPNNIRDIRLFEGTTFVVRNDSDIDAIKRTVREEVRNVLTGADISSPSARPSLAGAGG